MAYFINEFNLISPKTLLDFNGSLAKFELPSSL